MDPAVGSATLGSSLRRPCEPSDNPRTEPNCHPARIWHDWAEIRGFGPERDRRRRNRATTAPRRRATIDPAGECAVGPPGGREGMLPVERDDRVQARIDRLDPADVGVDDLDGRDLTGAHGACQVGR